MNRIDIAVNSFREGLSCSQAIASTYGPVLGLERETAIKAVSAFGAGMCRLGATCGAVTGAMMVIGLTMDLQDPESKERIFCLGKEFCQCFIKRNGSVNCTDLMGYDLSNPEELCIAKEKNIASTICVKLVTDAAEILEQMLSATVAVYDKVSDNG